VGSAVGRSAERAADSTVGLNAERAAASAADPNVVQVAIPAAAQVVVPVAVRVAGLNADRAEATAEVQVVDRAAVRDARAGRARAIVDLPDSASAISVKRVPHPDVRIGVAPHVALAINFHRL